jgi:hypothetical protein
MSRNPGPFIYKGNASNNLSISLTKSKLNEFIFLSNNKVQVNGKMKMQTFVRRCVLSRLV